MIERALLSVYDKAGLGLFATGLRDLGVVLVASGGTRAVLTEQNLPVTEVSALTASPEMMGGRVKTLHPRIHAGILARRDEPDDVDALEENDIRPFDLVCVNLYPFGDIVARKDTTEEAAVEMIDIGGPAMLRAAAKNFVHVVPICSSEQYEFVLSELQSKGEISVTTRRELAAEAFAYTAAYEATIANWFADRESFPDKLIVPLRKVTDLSYGENPHQRGAYYVEAGARRHLLSRVDQLGGKALSFNNLNDLNAARLIIEESDMPACAIVKHANPCGVAVGGSAIEAYAKALASDPVSAFGGVVAVNRSIDSGLAEILSEQFIEVVIAPSFSDDALEILGRRGGLRILANEERRRQIPGERDYRRVLGGMLVQDVDSDLDERDAMKVAAGNAPSEAEWGDLLFAWRVAKHVASNAIVLSKDLATIGIGGGQMSRVDAVKIAISKALEHGHDLRGSVLASDAFFPFADGPSAALDVGVVAIIQPGGSKRDAEVIEAVEKAGGRMVLSGRRHFRH